MVWYALILHILCRVEVKPVSQQRYSCQFYNTVVMVLKFMYSTQQQTGFCLSGK